MKYNAFSYLAEFSHVGLACYRDPRFSPFSGTCWPYLLPKSSVLPFFGHMLALLVTEILGSPLLRAHVGLTCYPNPRFSPFSGTCWPYLLPKSSVLLFFGHMLALLVTEIRVSLLFRAHGSLAILGSSPFSDTSLFLSNNDTRFYPFEFIFTSATLKFLCALFTHICMIPPKGLC